MNTMVATRILIIEGDKDAGHSLAQGLRTAGFEPTVVHSGQSALRLVRTLRPDLITLEVDLPDVPGTEVCRALRGLPETQRTPIIVISNRGEEIDRVVLFELGVDDYITKPFSFREVTLRLRARLRRVGRPGTGGDRSTGRRGDFDLDLEAHRAFVGDREVMLTPIETRLLATLCSRPDQVIARDDLHDRVWGRKPPKGSRVIDAQVKRLRKKLGPAAVKLQTIRGIGYRFASNDRRES
jgi:two-component system phosphate regulon response regulator PhoB